MFKIGDKIKVRCDDGSFNSRTLIVTGLRRGIVETVEGTFNKSDVRKA